MGDLDQLPGRERSVGDLEGPASAFWTSLCGADRLSDDVEAPRRGWARVPSLAAGALRRMLREEKMLGFAVTGSDMPPSLLPNSFRLAAEEEDDDGREQVLQSIYALGICVCLHCVTDCNHVLTCLNMFGRLFLLRWRSLVVRPEKREQRARLEMRE